MPIVFPSAEHSSAERDTAPQPRVRFRTRRDPLRLSPPGRRSAPGPTLAGLAPFSAHAHRARSAGGMQKNPITPEGAARLRDELNTLKSVERPAIIQAIATAREHGDLSENAEYHAARERQSFIE